MHGLIISKRTSVRRLINADEKLVLNSRSIMKELKDFYTCTSLYKNSESTDCDWRFLDFLNGVYVPKLSDNQKNLCEGLFSNSECFNALSKFPNGKTPGNDGLIHGWILQEILEFAWPPTERLFELFVHVRIHPTARLKYNPIYMYNDQDFNWKQIYLIPHKVTLQLRTRICQYKLLNRIVYTN